MNITCHRAEQRNHRSPRASHGLHVNTNQFLSRISRSCRQGESRKEPSKKLRAQAKSQDRVNIPGSRKRLPTCPFSIVFRLIARRLTRSGPVQRVAEFRTARMTIHSND